MTWQEWFCLVMLGGPAVVLVAVIVAALVVSLADWRRAAGRSGGEPP